MLFGNSCASCGRPGSVLCRLCERGFAPAPPGVSAPLLHAGSARRVVLGLKYRNARRAVRALAEHIAERVDDRVPVDVVTWAPTSARRIAERGYDPAELLAREVARRLRLPCRRLLARERRSLPQAGKGRAERLKGPRFRSRALHHAPKVLLIDDVITTGATLREGADALVRAGAGAVVCLAATAAP